jgi:hypothetical protein
VITPPPNRPVIYIVQIKWVHLNRSTTAASNLKQDQAFCRKKAQKTQSVDVSPFASPCAFLWLIALLSAFTDDKQTIRVNSGDTASI